MAKKKPGGVDAGSVNKPVPAMYPPDPAVKLKTPLKIVAFDLKTRTITIEGPTPPELLHAAEIERKRLDLNARLRGYAETCLKRLLPFLTPKERRAATKRKLPHSLRDDAPAEAHDALLTLKTLNRIVDELVQAGDWPDEIDRALCLAIDLGQLLQRGQTQLDHGANVDTGKRNKASTSDANRAKADRVKARKEAARQEYLRRMATTAGNRKKNQTLTNMATVMETDGITPKYGSLGTLKRWSRDWNGRTPSE